MTDSKMTDGSLALQDKQRRIITIAASETPQDITLRVAAYARVSSSSDDQLNSFAAQNRYYTTLISSKENWTLVDIYADEGVTGTSSEKREDFQRLLADCRKGLIDRVLVKSISRFARNTKECLEAIRELKSLGVGICFEKEHINTGTMSGEMITTLFASFAQAESQSISGNMRWSYKRRMQSGEFNTCKNPFGYRLKDGKLEVYEPEAVIVREIFDRYLSGESCEDIAKYVSSLGVPTRDGKMLWQQTTIAYLLRNERYAGNALLQKKYSTDTFPAQKRINHGEVPKYLVSGSNPPIVSMETFEAAAALLQQRLDKAQRSQPKQEAFSRKIYCGNCGSRFRKREIRGSVYWICISHDRARTSCPITQIPELEFQSAFLRLYHKLKHHGQPILSQMVSSLQLLRNRRMLWSPDVIELNKLIADLTSQNQVLAELKKQSLIDPDIFISQTNELAEQLRAAKLKKERLSAADGDNTIAQTLELMELLETGPDFLENFDAELFGGLVEKIIVDSNERVRFRLKNGLELAETIERTVR